MWTTLEIGGKQASVFHPESGSPRFGLVFLHPVGGETLVDNAVYTEMLEERRLACVSPHGGLSWWADRICPAFDPEQSAESFILTQVVPLVRSRWSLPPRTLGLFGISMGGQGALRLAFKHPREFPVVAGISSALDYQELLGRGTPLDEMYHSKEQCRQDTAILHIHPSHYPPHIFFCIDPDDTAWFRGNDRLHEKLNALGIAHQCDLATRAGGHSWDYFNHQAGPTLDFLVDGLEKESRRLL